MLDAVALPLPVTLLTQLLVLFFAGVLAHGRLAEERPAPERLTEFYFLLSLGGVLGGALNALVAPLVFDSVLEYPLVLVLALALRRSRPPDRGHRSGPGRSAAAWPALRSCKASRWRMSVLAGAVVACLAIGVRHPRYLTLGFACLTLLLARGLAEPAHRANVLRGSARDRTRR